jgi:dTDP-4-dehydrorhamnose 3,5-epimerase
MEIQQANISLTRASGTLRGLHYQNPPATESRIVRCLAGAIFDVAVDLRRGSPTFLQWHGEILTGRDWNALYIPQGFAHGFQTLEPDSTVLYFHSGFYSPNLEGGFRFDDPRIGVKWPLDPSEVSARDRNHPLLTSDFSGLDVLGGTS